MAVPLTFRHTDPVASRTGGQALGSTRQPVVPAKPIQKSARRRSCQLHVCCQGRSREASEQAFRSQTRSLEGSVTERRLNEEPQRAGKRPSIFCREGLNTNMNWPLCPPAPLQV